MKNAVNFDRFNPPEKLLKTMKKSLGINDKLVIGHVGRFTFAKNHKFLINIFKNITDCRQSPGICRDFYYEHCFSGIIELSERRCFL